ncbi:MAG: hypothetical protein QM690_04410 [Sphingobium sp.]
MATMLESFVGDAPGNKKWDWDDFTSVKASPELEPFRQRLLEQGDGYMDTHEIREIIAEPRS